MIIINQQQFIATKITKYCNSLKQTLTRQGTMMGVEGWGIPCRFYSPPGLANFDIFYYGTRLSRKNERRERKRKQGLYSYLIVRKKYFFDK